MTFSKPFIIGVAGGSGSGKTTLANILQTALPWRTCMVGLDQFYCDLTHLTMEERRNINFDDPRTLDLDLATAAVERLRQGQTASMPVYDFATCNRTAETISVSPAPIIIVDGMYALEHDPLVQLYDIGLFLDVDEPTRWQRKLERDLRERGRTYEQVLTMWNRFTRPMHNKFVQPTKSRATMVFTDSFAPQVIKALTQELEHKIALSQNTPGVLP
jgi:uridine kinase